MMYKGIGSKDKIDEGEEQIIDFESWDDVSGEPLDTRKVKQAREEEMTEFHKHTVYRKVPIRESWEKTGKAPLDIRWIDINKGDEENQEYRSRLVAKKIKMDKREDLFAATPLLEAKKMIFSLAATEKFEEDGTENRNKIDFVDVRRAYFHAKARRDVYIELPEEDYEK